MREQLKSILIFWWVRTQVWWSIRHERRTSRGLARAEKYIIHRHKTEWLFSGVTRDANGFYSDAGFTRSPRSMNRAQALRYFRRFNPNATLNHVDDKNKIITFTGR